MTVQGAVNLGGRIRIGRGTTVALAMLMVGTGLVATHPWHDGPVSEPWRLAFASVVAASCLVGLAAAAWPGLASLIADPVVGKVRGGQGLAGACSLEELPSTHHPDCERFEGHTVVVNGSPRCAGCLGLGVGSAIGLGIATALGMGWLPSTNPGSALVAANGAAVALAALAQGRAIAAVGWGRAVSSALLVVGTLLVIAAMMSTGVALGVGGVVLGFSMFGTRMYMHGERHERVCADCGLGPLARSHDALTAKMDDAAVDA
jgi:hypothetical protein